MFAQTSSAQWISRLRGNLVTKFDSFTDLIDGTIAGPTIGVGLCPTPLSENLGRIWLAGWLVGHIFQIFVATNCANFLK